MANMQRAQERFLYYLEDEYADGHGWRLYYVLPGHPKPIPTGTITNDAAQPHAIFAQHGKFKGQTEPSTLLFRNDHVVAAVGPLVRKQDGQVDVDSWIDHGQSYDAFNAAQKAISELNQHLGFSADEQARIIGASLSAGEAYRAHSVAMNMFELSDVTFECLYDEEDETITVSVVDDDALDIACMSLEQARLLHDLLGRRLEEADS